MASFGDIARRMAQYEKSLQGRVEGREVELLRIFLSAEKTLFDSRAEILGQLAVEGEKLVKGNANLGRVESLITQVDGILREKLVDPGRDWADAAIAEGWKDGRQMASINLSLIDERIAREAFRQVSVAEAGVLQVGIEDSYKIVGTVGDDVGQFFRGELTESITLGRPVQGPGSLTERLFESGRLKPIKVRTKDGKIITRTVRQRAVAIARVETAKVMNRVHQVETEEVFEEFGETQVLYVNVNPMDHVTTPECEDATKAGPMSLAQWDASRFGRPPRLDPFHLCRSYLMAGTRRQLQQAGYRRAA